MDDGQPSPVHSNGNLEDRAELPPASPIEASKAPPVQVPVDDGTAKVVEDVLYSDVGVFKCCRIGMRLTLPDWREYIAYQAEAKHCLRSSTSFLWRVSLRDTNELLNRTSQAS